MRDRNLYRLVHGVEALAATTLGRPTRVLWLEEGDSAAEAQARYFAENPEARGRVEILCLTLPSEPAARPASRSLPSEDRTRSASGLDRVAEPISGVRENAVDVRLAHRDFVHLAAVRAFDFGRCLPSSFKALRICLDAGRCLLIGFRANEKK
jgi:hypothetical protein